VEAELESEEPMEMGGDASTSKDEGDRGIIVTSVEHHEPTATSIGGGQDTEKRANVLESRKRAASEDTSIEREVKRARSPCPSEASLARHPPALSMVGHTGQSEEHVRAPHIFGVGACARPTMGRCPVSCSGGFATSWRS